MTKKLTAIKKRMTKAQLISKIAEETSLSKTNVKVVLTSLAEQATRHLKYGGCGEFMVPEIGVKLKRVKKPATKARKGTNPFTGKEIMFKAKPAYQSVRAVSLKACKDMVDH